jgi:hypothetical protein
MFLSVVLGAGFLSTALDAYAQEAAPVPPHKNGDFWRFKAREWDWVSYTSDPIDGIYEISATGGKLRIFKLSGDQKAEVDPRPPVLSLLIGFAQNPNLKFPLAVGQNWKFEYRIGARGAKEVSRTVEIKVTGTEQVTTPAGTFTAFKLEKDDRKGPKDFWVTTYWYSPETKSVVKSLFDSSSGLGAGGKREIELIKVGTAP